MIINCCEVLKLNHIVLVMQFSNNALENTIFLNITKLKDYAMPLFFMVLELGITASQTEPEYESN